ncbi:FeoA family protein [Caloranaerobacter ferrireducens]|uniref:FeoA family protein n=1 Tax=Caloranaerobacter ferrireducens TaxID=1323370 RepID=UPI00084D8293|nr:FeoA family protein [Caloranaerobacter ferrireducens]
MTKAHDGSKVIPAVKMKSGEEGIIAELDTDSKSILRKLMAMGILPGMKIKMIQTFPSYVFQVGYTQVAVDKEIASVILVNQE